MKKQTLGLALVAAFTLAALIGAFVIVQRNQNAMLGGPAQSPAAFGH